MPNYTLNPNRTPDGNARDMLVPDSTTDAMVENQEDIEEKVDVVDSVADAVLVDIVEVQKNLNSNYSWFGKALEDGGYEIAGAVLPEFNGSYYADGTLNTKTSYANKDGAGFLWWDGVDSWVVSAASGVLGTDHFIRVDASAVGAFTNVGSADGTVTGADIADAEHKADRIGAGISAFQIDAGNETWGTWVQLLGSDDTPVTTLMTKFKADMMFVTDGEAEVPYMIQFGRGASGAAALAAGDYTELIIGVNTTTQLLKEIVEIQTERASAGDLLWARCLAIGTNTATLDFYFGIKEYMV